MKAAGNDEDQSGAAAVEFALVVPILFLLVFGIIEFGFIFNRWISVTHASREGARLLAVNVPEDSLPAGCNPNAAPPPNGTCTTLGAETRAARGVPSITNAPVACEGGLPEAAETTQPDETIITSDGSREVQMTCSTPYTLRLLRMLPIKSNLVLTATTKMRKEGT